MNDHREPDRAAGPLRPLRALLTGALLAGGLAACGAGYEVCTTHYPDGELWSVRYYSGSRPDRPWVAWHGNGVPRVETDYADGARTGTWRTLTREGRLLFERNYLDDAPHGAWRRFHADGRRASEKFFEQGRPVGTWTWWDAAGAVVRQERHGDGPATGDPTSDGPTSDARDS